MKSIYRLKGRGPRTGLEENQGRAVLGEKCCRKVEGDEDRAYRLGSGNWGIIGNLCKNSFNHVGEVEFKLQGERGVSGWEEVVGVHRDDSLERLAVKGRLKIVR